MRKLNEGQETSFFSGCQWNLSYVIALVFTKTSTLLGQWNYLPHLYDAPVNYKMSWIIMTVEMTMNNTTYLGEILKAININVGATTALS